MPLGRNDLLGFSKKSGVASTVVLRGVLGTTDNAVIFSQIESQTGNDILPILRSSSSAGIAYDTVVLQGPGLYCMEFSGVYNSSADSVIWLTKNQPLPFSTGGPANVADIVALEKSVNNSFSQLSVFIFAMGGEQISLNAGQAVSAATFGYLRVTKIP